MKNKLLKELQNYTAGILSAYSEIFFLHGIRVGAALLVLSFFNFNVAISGLLSVIVVLTFAKFIHMESDFIRSGFYVYNPLLVGMSIGFLFKITFISAILITLSALLTFLLTIVLFALFSRSALPILSLPFTFVSSMVYLASLSYTSLFTSALYVHETPFIFDVLPLYISAYFTALGTILFMPNVFVGVMFALILFTQSRLIFFASLMGFYSGVFFHALLLGSFYTALSNPYSFNYILIAIALSMTFLVPSMRSVVIAIIGVAMSVLVIDASSAFWTIYKIPVFALPFNIVVIFLLYVLRSVKFSEIAYEIKTTPEKTLEYSIMSKKRFRSGEIALFLPFSGTWNVYQGFDDEWTHQGDWKYAYDFIITDDEAKSYKNSGDFLSDYYAYQKPVLSPVSAYVVETMSYLEDNQIGEVDNVQNWGNFIILQTLSGVFVELSHFAKDSIVLKRGDYVEVGQFLGLCGNSGYSPQPHIHIQVQESAYLGSKTVPFNFVSNIHNTSVKFYDRPQKNTTISAYFNDRALERKMSFILDSYFEYEVYIHALQQENMKISVGMDRLSGLFYLYDQAQNRLYFSKDAGMFYFYDYQGSWDDNLAKIYCAIPRFPLNTQKGLYWSDVVMSRAIEPTLINRYLNFGAMFSSKNYLIDGSWKFEDEKTISGILDTNENSKIRIELDDEQGFKRIDIGEFSFRKKGSKIL